MPCITAIRFYRLLICFFLVAQVLLGQKSYAIQTGSDPKQLSRMKTSYREWLSTAEKRDLLVEFDPSPQGLDIRSLRFSWIVPLEGRGRNQTGYQIQVASSSDLFGARRPDMWN